MSAKVQIYCHENRMAGTISYYRLPDGRMIYRNAEAEDRIDLEPLRPFIGHEVEVHTNGSLEGDMILSDITKHESGVDMIVFQPKLAV